MECPDGGSPFMTVKERVAPAAVWKPEVASLNMGSMNFGLFPMLRRYKEFRFDWEPKMLEMRRNATGARRKAARSEMPLAS